jgi:deltex-like protein
MSISFPPITNNLKCKGFATWDTIVIVYSMQAGIQKHYHENPGQRHPGKHETTYIPNNTAGRNLLKRLKFAFLHGLTFTIGTSMTTGAANQCTWSSIHHKTSPNSGVHGFPDPKYFANCNGELDSANVPAANLLDVNGQKLVTSQRFKTGRLGSLPVPE